MWRDIALANRTALGEAIDAYRAQLDAVAALIAASDAAELQALFARAAAARRAWGPTYGAVRAVPADGSREP